MQEGRGCSPIRAEAAGLCLGASSALVLKGSWACVSRLHSAHKAVCTFQYHVPHLSHVVLTAPHYLCERFFGCWHVFLCGRKTEGKSRVFFKEGFFFFSLS